MCTYYFHSHTMRQKCGGSCASRNMKNIYTYTHTNTYINAYAYIFIYVYVKICTPYFLRHTMGKKCGGSCASRSTKYIYTHAHTHTHTHIHKRICKCIYFDTRIYSNIYILFSQAYHEQKVRWQLCESEHGIFIFTHTHTHTHIHKHICICIYFYICIHTNMYILFSQAYHEQKVRRQLRESELEVSRLGEELARMGHVTGSHILRCATYVTNNACHTIWISHA